MSNVFDWIIERPIILVTLFMSIVICLAIFSINLQQNDIERFERDCAASGGRFVTLAYNPSCLVDGAEIAY